MTRTPDPPRDPLLSASLWGGGLRDKNPVVWLWQALHRRVLALWRFRHNREIAGLQARALELRYQRLVVYVDHPHPPPRLDHRR